MGLRIKDGIGIDELRKYGFELGSVLKEKESFDRVLNDIGYKYMWGWAHKFLMDIDEPEHIRFTDEEYDIPMVHIYIRLGEDGDRTLEVDAAPSCTYHIGGSELDVVTDTIFEMTHDGILEAVKQTEG